MSMFEIVMLVCFGSAWPFSIYRSWKSKTVKGKSLAFLVIVMVGYISGILHKIFFNNDPVIYMYITNLILVSVDTALYVRYRRN
jgi:hypothetical protein